MSYRAFEEVGEGREWAAKTDRMHFPIPIGIRSQGMNS
jgi:hypothetical protein